MSNYGELKIIDVGSEDAVLLDQVRELFLEYARSLPISLDFQGFDEEFKSLPKPYHAPLGRLCLFYIDSQPIGCGSIKEAEPGGRIAEMKRVYLRPLYQGRGLGRQVANILLQSARDRGYELIRLDTLSSMHAAQALYQSLGFYEIPPYRFNPDPGAIYLELKL